MSTKTHSIEEQPIHTLNETQSLAEISRSLQEIVNKVQRDSQLEPQLYLDETKVPHGGE